MSKFKILAITFCGFLSLKCLAQETTKIPENVYFLSVLGSWEYPTKELGVNTRTAYVKIVYFESAGTYFELTGTVIDNPNQATPYYFSDGGGYSSASGTWSLKNSEVSIAIKSIARGISLVRPGLDPLCKMPIELYKLDSEGLHDSKGHVYTPTEKLVTENLQSYFLEAKKSKIVCPSNSN